MGRHTMEVRLNTATGTTSRFATEQAQRLLGRLAFQIARTIRSGGAREVHDLRVAIRRFLRVLVVLKQCFPRKESRKVRRVLKKIRAQAGTVRDHDIALRLLKKLAPAGSGLPVRELRSARDEASRALAASLKSWVRRNLSAKWRGALAGGSPNAKPIPVTAARLLPPMAREFFEWGDAAAREKADASELHRFRIAAKNFRYTLELLAPIYGESAGALLEQLKGVQTVLGEINDCATVRRLVPRDAGSREMLSALKKRQRKKTEAFRREWAAFNGAASVRQWMASLRHPGASEAPARKPPGRVAHAPLTHRSASA